MDNRERSRCCPIYDVLMVSKAQRSAGTLFIQRLGQWTLNRTINYHRDSVTVSLSHFAMTLAFKSQWVALKDTSLFSGHLPLQSWCWRTVHREHHCFDHEIDHRQWHESISLDRIPLLFMDWIQSNLPWNWMWCCFSIQILLYLVVVHFNHHRIHFHSLFAVSTPKES